MKKIVLIALGSILTTAAFAQVDTLMPVTPAPVAQPKSTRSLAGRANDHFLIQLGHVGWTGAPDSVKSSGFSKSLNVYFMFDFPFKTNPKFSIAAGPGISSDQIKFKRTYVDITSNTPTLQFRNIFDADSNRFASTKLSTVYAELPVELRFTADPYNSDRSMKFAVGLRPGFLLKAGTKNKELENKSGQTVKDYVMKESSKNYFNKFRLSAIARIGWGHFSLFGSYQITTLFTEGAFAEVRPYSVGLTLSGL